MAIDSSAKSEVKQFLAAVGFASQSGQTRKASGSRSARRDDHRRQSAEIPMPFLPLPA
jgi:hypothetical protein